MMGPGGSSYRREIPHKITVDGLRQIRRDGTIVRVERVSDTEIKVGCTVVEIDALKRLLQMADTKILQEGAA